MKLQFLSFVVVFLLPARSVSLERVFYIGVVEIEWNYAPEGYNKIKGTNFTVDSSEATYGLKGPSRIGTTYRKAVYREFTDETFSVQKDQAAWLGTLGPYLRAEVGDRLIIKFKNMATKPFSIHPHGVFYDKDSEGAVYEDKTSGEDKLDDSVAPGNTHTYTWIANERAGPAAGDSDCQTWMYHSHIDSPAGTSTGLLGPLIICKKGILEEDGTRNNVDKEFFLMFTVEDENLSYYIEENIQEYCTDSVDPDDEDFLESNKMRSINSFVYGNLPGLEVCQGDRVAWHIIAMGTEIDVHTITFYGNVMTNRGHRRDVFSLSPAAMYDVLMTPRNVGTWLVSSNVLTHAEAGMQALYTVKDSCGPSVEEAPLNGDVREFFIAAVKERWDYAPSGINKFDGSNLTDSSRPQSTFFSKENGRIGGVYNKAVFREFTDNSYTTRKYRPENEEYLGFLGPMIRAEVGDTIVVHLWNNISQPISLHASGVFYNKSNEGVLYNDETEDKSDDSVQPEDSYTYTWTIPERYGPTENDPQCLTYTYQSTVNPQRDLYSGLIGPLLVCKMGALDADGKQNNVDREFFLLVSRFDENESWLIDENIAEFAPTAQKDSEDFIASNQLQTINGRMYSNLDNLTTCLWDHVSWHLMGVGQETDQNTIYFHGGSFVYNGQRRDSFPLFPGVSGTLNMTVENAGLWAIDALTNDHYVNGLQALYEVKECGGGRTFSSKVDRTYYIAAVETNWNYAPIMYDPVRNENLEEEESTGNVFVRGGDTFIGSTYKKALFFEYTDESFTVQKTRPEELGFFGAPIYIEEGETIQVVFKNMATRPFSIHAHGVEYIKADEGVQYGGVGNSAGVPPNQMQTYTWEVSKSRGPSMSEANCTPFVYYSGVDYEHDIFSGLVGPLVICKSGTLDSNGARTDLDKEFFLFFMVSDENKSWYLDENIQRYCQTPSAVDKEDGDFLESNLMHGINGRIYSNLKDLTMELNQRVEWYLMGMGNEVDLHSVHFHGQTVLYRTEQAHRTDVFELFPGVSSALQMTPDNPGIWLLHCHVNDHELGGMEATFMVTSGSRRVLVHCLMLVSLFLSSFLLMD